MESQTDGGFGSLTGAPQNRELQIMRIVRHPNIVELKAFYYSNGDRVCVFHGPPIALFRPWSSLPRLQWTDLYL
jgi:serine/threonine protein kinase